MGDGVAVSGGRVEMGYFFSVAEREVPESFAAGAFFKRKEEGAAFLNKECVFLYRDEFFAGFLDRERGGIVCLAEGGNGACITFC